jgi:hypothetical protein
MKPEINNKREAGKITNTWKLNNMYLKKVIQYCSNQIQCQLTKEYKENNSPAQK